MDQIEAPDGFATLVAVMECGIAGFEPHGDLGFDPSPCVGVVYEIMDARMKLLEEVTETEWRAYPPNRFVSVMPGTLFFRVSID